MKTQVGILLAGGAGILIGIGIFGLKQFLKKKSQEYDDYYADFHRHFVKLPKEENNDGVEFLAVL
ncbi:hypothetical protein OA84_03805 [Kaistella solincola]|uniref:Uncharacterized protein n=1 Tax=Kaistella solincola TaxID=510955 RepID=A0ABR4ZTV8_9FLAO|nr:hypothetical protein [Kaistella solincola]KIA84639.1 hypothetical protein OA84_03805 [Kaistella solincola]